MFVVPGSKEKERLRERESEKQRQKELMQLPNEDAGFRLPKFDLRHLCILGFLAVWIYFFVNSRDTSHRVPINPGAVIWWNISHFFGDLFWSFVKSVGVVLCIVIARIGCWIFALELESERTAKKNKAAEQQSKKHSWERAIKDPDNSGKILCPECGSTNLTAQKMGFSLPKAVAGAAMFGGVGLVGGVIGSSKIKITCLKCGKKFRPGEGTNKL